MSPINYIVYGFIRRNCIDDLELKLSTISSIEISNNKKLFTERDYTVYTVVHDYPEDDEFNQTCDLYVYAERYETCFSVYSIDQANSSSIDIRSDRFIPFSILFNTFDSRYKSTFMPILGRLLQIFGIIRPVVAFSTAYENISDFNSNLEDEEFFNGFLSLNTMHKYISGCLAICSEIEESIGLFNNPNIHAVREYDGGVIAYGPCGVGHYNVNPAYAFDSLGKLYIDEELDDAILRIHNTTVKELRLASKRIRFNAGDNYSD